MVKMFSFYNIPEIKRMKLLLLKSLEQDASLTIQEKDDLLGDAEVAESFLCYNDISAMSDYHRRACTLLSRATLSIDQKGAWTFAAPSILMMYHRREGYANRENADMKEGMPYFYQLSNGHGNGAEHSFAADLFWERGQITDADISRHMALSAARRKNQYSIMLCCEFLSMRMAMLQGDYESIKRQSQNLREWLQKERQYTLSNTLDMCLGFIYALLGSPENAPKWLVEGRLSEALVMFPATPMLNTFYNQLLLSQGEWTALVARREDCEKLYDVYNNVLCKIWLHIQLAAALKQIGKQEEARKELKTALDMALPDGIIMPFAEGESYIFDLLKELQDSGVYAEEISHILNLAGKFRAARQKIRMEHFGEQQDYGLSARELEIAMMAAHRKTNMEIAEELHIAEGTVRNQLSRIFDKLGISGDGKNKRLSLENFLNIQK